MPRYLLLFLILFTSFHSLAQVLDDSTKQIYGNKSVEYFYEADIIRNIDRKYHPDSSLLEYHLADPVRKSGWMYQDLGMPGTASKPLLFSKSLEIGQNMAMNSNKLYAPKISDFKYYNTRSPYTYLGYEQARGLTEIEVTHSQNINPRLNLTLNIYKFNSEKQYDYKRSGDLLVNHWKYDFGGNYISKNEKYRVMATFYHFNNQQYEQGGVLNGTSLALADIQPKYDRAYDAALKGDIVNRERWNNFHLYQQLIMKSTLQTFHTLDYEHKFYSFIDPDFGSEANANFYGIQPISPSDTLYYNYKFQSISNRFGFKGIYKGFNYQAYAKHRVYKLDNAFYPAYSSNWKNEIYLGGLVGYIFADSTNTLNIKSELASDQNYLLDATLFYKGFEIEAYNAAIPTGLYFKKFQNGVIDFSENKDFKAENSKYFAARFPIQYKRFKFIPEGRWASIKNYTYMQSPFKTKQSVDDINLLTIALNAKYATKQLSLSYKYYYTFSSDKSVYPVPKHIHVTNLDFNFLYAKVLRINTGFDMYFNSGFFGYNYSPLTAQFYQYGKQKIGGVPVMDIYVKFPLSKGRVSVSYSYLNRGFGFVDVNNFGKNGFFTSPGYLASRGGLTIKIDWPLFD